MDLFKQLTVNLELLRIFLLSAFVSFWQLEDVPNVKIYGMFPLIMLHCNYVQLNYLFSYSIFTSLFLILIWSFVVNCRRWLSEFSLEQTNKAMWWTFFPFVVIHAYLDRAVCYAFTGVKGSRIKDIFPTTALGRRTFLACSIDRSRPTETQINRLSSTLFGSWHRKRIKQAWHLAILVCASPTFVNAKSELKKCILSCR